MSTGICATHVELNQLKLPQLPFIATPVYGVSRGVHVVEESLLRVTSCLLQMHNDIIRVY